jgi:hypothetical protein
MKTIRIYAVLFFIASLITISCDKNDDVFMSDGGDNSETKGQKAQFKGSRTVILTPAGVEFDTQNFLAAIEQAKSFGPAAKIYLDEGIFYFDKIDVFDFYGTIMGAGREKTIIKSLPGGINLPVYEPTNEIWPYFISFFGGNLIMKDLSFFIEEEKPIKPYEHWSKEGDLTIMGSIIWVTGNDPDNFTATSRFTNVGFTGKMVNLYNYAPYNTDNCIIFGGSHQGRPLKGNHTIQNCYFNTTEAAMLSMGGYNSTIIFGGSPKHGNTLNDVNAGVFIMDGDKMNFILSHNKMYDVRSYAGIYISQRPSNYFSTFIKAGKSSFIIQNNEIHVIGMPYGDGVSMLDFAGLEDPTKKSSYLVSHNHFSLTGGSQCAVFSYGSYNANIIRNSIIGKSEHAIGLWRRTSNWNLVMNEFEDYESTWYDVVLGPLTHDNKVIGDTQTSILDMSGNNQVINPVTKMQSLNAPVIITKPILLKYAKDLPQDELDNAKR